MTKSIIRKGVQTLRVVVSLCGALARGKATPGKAGGQAMAALKDFFRYVKTPARDATRKQAMALVSHGAHLYNEQQYRDALEHFNEASDLDPTYARAHLYAGNTLYKLHQYPGALSAWETAMRVEPDSEAARKAREKINRVLEQGNTAAAALQKGLAGKRSASRG